ncbi:MAG: FAD-dependent oxidoreductase [Gammaproteobacteria bacterium]
MADEAVLFQHLFSPLRVGGLTLKNRIVHLATLTQYADHHRVTPTLIDYHKARAEGGAAMSIVEGLAVHPSSVPLRSVITAFDPASADGLKRLAAAGEERGCRMLGQLWHVGRQQLWSPIDAPVGVSDQPDPLSWTVPLKADAALIRTLIAAFVDCAKRLQDCGFSGVELHGAHGYLLTQFMSPWSNTRDDDYGGDLARRLRVVRDIIHGIRQNCGAGFVVGLKLPAQEGVAGGIDLAEAIRITAHLVAQAQPDYFAYSQGNFSQSLEDHNPNMFYHPGHFLQLHKALRPHAQGVPVMAVGRVTDAGHGERILAEGSADLIGLCRALIADPALPIKAQSGRLSEVRPCIFCNLCWGEIHAGKPLLCIHNPKLPAADEADWRPPRSAKSAPVVVVGAGPAGLEAAWNAAARGHRVMLMGASPQAGGALRLDARLPGRAEVAKVYEYQLRQAERYGVEFVSNRAATIDDIIAHDPRLVVLATGGEPRPPAGLTAESPVFSWRDKVRELVEDDRRRAGTAVLFDMDHSDATYAFADLLALRYQRLALLTPRVQLARAAPYTNAIGIYRRLYAADALSLTAVRPVRYDASGVTYANVFNGKEGVIDDVALFAYSTPRRARDTLYQPLVARGFDVRLIGDARSPRTLFSAVHEGFAAAHSL